LLAKCIAKLLECPYSDGCLSKINGTPELKAVYDYEERLRQLTGAYAVEPAVTNNRAILLVDDLYRSGATLEAATNALMKKGRARSVCTLTFTRTRSNR
jgi:predicted amidophosphoribosyltransferase